MLDHFTFGIGHLLASFVLGALAVIILRWWRNDSDVLFFPDPKMPCFSFYWELEGQRNVICKRPNCEFAHKKGGEYTSLMKLFETLNKATKTIDLCIFHFTLDFLANFVITASHAGIRVRIITDSHSDRKPGNDQDQYDRIPKIQEAGIPVRLIKDTERGGLMHNKFVVIDGTYLLMGSFNWTRSAVLYNQESIIKTSERRILKKFRKKFQDLWQQSLDKPYTKSPSTRQQSRRPTR